MHAIKRVCAGAALGAVLVGSLSTGAALAAESPVKAALAAGSSQSAGSLTVKVVNAANPNLGLPGVAFALRDSTGTVIGFIDAMGPDGTAEATDVAPGDYTLVPVSWPGGYSVDQYETHVTVSAGERVTAIVPFGLAAGDTRLVVRVIDWNTGAPVRGASFEVRDDFGQVVGNIGQTGEDGTAEITGLAPGSYVLRHTSSLGNYALFTDPIPVIVAAGETHTPNIPIGIPARR